jgi:hypothetical protein
MNCSVCSVMLSGKQTKFCSKVCKSRFHNFNSEGRGHQVYAYQRSRGIERKDFFIKEKGGKCEMCGYSKCRRALTFHHRDPNTKSFELNVRTLGNMSQSKCEEEAKKCDLLCFNCHMELHDNNGLPDQT